MSVVLACAGIAFAYYVSLPASLHFLTTFGNSGDIHALITANEYFNFVLAYVAGFAILFQVPLIILFINRMTPLPPMKLLMGTRYVIVFSFIAAAIITPTPDPMNQAIMAVPIIALYIFSVGIVALQPKRFKQRKQAKQAAKREWLEKQFEPIAKPLPVAPVVPKVVQPRPVAAQVASVIKPVSDITAQPSAKPMTHRANPQRRAGLISDFAPRRPATPAQRPQVRREAQHQPRPFIDITVRRPNIAGA